MPQKTNKKCQKMVQKKKKIRISKNKKIFYFYLQSQEVNVSPFFGQFVLETKKVKNIPKLFE